MIDGLLTMSWISRTIRDENPVKVVSDLVDGEVVWEDSGTCTTANQASQDILLDTTVDNSDVHVSILRADVERCFGAASYSSPIVILAKDDPTSRRYVTIARVSTPEIAGTPSRAHQSLKLSTAVQ